MKYSSIFTIVFSGTDLSGTSPVPCEYLEGNVKCPKHPTALSTLSLHLPLGPPLQALPRSSPLEEVDTTSYFVPRPPLDLRLHKCLSSLVFLSLPSHLCLSPHLWDNKGSVELPHLDPRFPGPSWGENKQQRFSESRRWDGWNTWGHFPNVPQLRNPLGSVGLWLLHGKEAEVGWGGVG